MRLFIAIELRDEVKEALAAAIAQLRPRSPDSKWVKAEKTHLTLCFLGHLEEPLLPKLEAAMQEVATRHRPFPLSFAGGGAFGGRARPRVLYVSVGGSADPLAALQADLVRAVSALGVVLEDRPYAPHLTLARARHPRGDAGLAECVEALAGSELGGQRVTELVLFQSRTSPSGAEYQPLLRAPLSSAAE